MLDPCLYNSGNHIRLKLLRCQLKYREANVVARPEAIVYGKELSESLKINLLG